MNRRNLLQSASAGLLASAVSSQAQSNALLQEGRGRPFAAISMGGLDSKIGGMLSIGERTLRIPLPERFGKDELERIRVDCERMSTALRERPKEMQELFSAVSQNRIRAASTLAQKLGITEKEYKAKGGGLIWFLVAAAAAAILLLSEGEAE